MDCSKFLVETKPDIPAVLLWGFFVVFFPLRNLFHLCIPSGMHKFVFRDDVFGGHTAPHAACALASCGIGAD